MYKPAFTISNKIKSIYSSLVIEANSLSFNEVRDIIAGKKVIGPIKEIQEVKNAYKAYEMIKEFDGYKEENLKIANQIITNLMIDDCGKYRKQAEGVFNGENVIFIA